MNGFVDEIGRAMLDVSLSATRNGNRTLLRVWVDTAFNGGLVVPQQIVANLGLRESTTTEAILADGKCVNLAMYTCFLDWFGGCYRTQVVANDGEFALLGTMLLADRDLTISYRRKSVVLE